MIVEVVLLLAIAALAAGAGLVVGMVVAPAIGRLGAGEDDDADDVGEAAGHDGGTGSTVGPVAAEDGRMIAEEDADGR